jgi:hypothetical protein
MYSAVPMLTAAGRASHAPLLSLSLLLLLLRMSVELSLLRPQLGLARPPFGSHCVCCNVAGA